MKNITVNEKEFTVVRLLGKGKGGYSYLATDGQEQYVVKQIHHEPCEYYQFGNKIEAEIKDYERLKNIGITMPELLDVDLSNERILKQYIEGKTIFQMVWEGDLPENCMEQVRQMCDKLYPAKTNIDYYPTNFVLQDGILYYIDYECNDYMEEWNFENWGIKYWSKTPEFVAATRKGIDPIAYCGFSCNHCFLSEGCGSCRSDYNCCSYATICDGGLCPNVTCCQEKGIDGCYECEELEHCGKGFYTPGNDGADACKAQAIFISRHGKESFLEVHDMLHKDYPDFKKTQEIMGHSVQEGLALMEKYVL